MKEDHYLIKEAAQCVGVETHVLRYWEEELKMDIHRNELGHRYYTQKDVEILKKVKELKDRGIQLKGIRNYLEMRKEQIKQKQKQEQEEEQEQKQEQKQEQEQVQERKQEREQEREQEQELEQKQQDKQLVTIRKNVLSNEEKMEQFKNIMNKIVSDAIAQNNELIGKSAGEHAAQAMEDKMSGMSKEQERISEERFKKLDQTLREIQQARLEAAATNMRPVDRRRQARLKRNSSNKGKKPENQTEIKKD